jgi:hypothetical protein
MVNKGVMWQIWLMKKPRGSPMTSQDIFLEGPNHLLIIRNPYQYHETHTLPLEVTKLSRVTYVKQDRIIE